VLFPGVIESDYHQLQAAARLRKRFVKTPRDLGAGPRLDMPTAAIGAAGHLASPRVVPEKEILVHVGIVLAGEVPVPLHFGSQKVRADLEMTIADEARFAP